MLKNILDDHFSKASFNCFFFFESGAMPYGRNEIDFFPTD